MIRFFSGQHSIQFGYFSNHSDLPVGETKIETLIELEFTDPIACISP
jgi:hypothetical protein